MNVRTRQGGKAAEKYASFVGKQVIVYYRDMRDTDRKLYGVITEVSGDMIYMQNGGWSGVLDCRHARVSLVSTVEGWNRETETNEERGWLRKIFNK